MWINTKIVYDIETLRVISRAGYEYAGPVDYACSDSAQVEASDVALQTAQTAMTQTLNSNYQTDFAEQQSVLANQQAKLQAMATNPLGYTPQQLSAATTSINENTANAAKSALGSAAAYAAAHGGADVGSGATGMVAGAIGSAAATSKAAQLTSLSENNQNLKQQNYWNAIQGLNSVGAQYGGSGATAIGGANSAAEGAVNAGSGATAAGNAGWQDLGSLLGGIGALVTGGAGIAKDFTSPSGSDGGGNSGGNIGGS